MCEPLDDLTAMFFRMLYEACHGNCVIAGSAALAYYLLPDVLFENNDVDIFVPALPQIMNEFTKSGIRLHPKTLQKGEPIEYVIHKILRKLRKYNGLSVRQPRQNDRGSQVIKFHGVPYYLNEVINIESIATFQLTQSRMKSKVIQIIVLHGYPTINQPAFSNNVWGEYVISTFDLDIVQVFLTPRAYSTRSNTYHVSLTNKLAGSIHRRDAHMTILPCQHHSQVIKRLDKYMARKFTIRSIQFHEDTPTVWINYLVRKIIEHNADLTKAIDIVRIPAVLHATTSTHQRNFNFRRFMRPSHDEAHLLYQAYLNLRQRRANNNARESLDYTWR
jgi:hypothetical protein